MKKLLVVLLALTAVGAAAFADGPTWTWGAVLNTGAQITVPSTGSTMVQVWDANEPAISRFRLNGGVAAGDYGLNFRFAWAGDVPANAVNTVWWVWAKMFNMALVEVGVNANTYTDTANKGWGGMGVSGAQVSVTPIENLTIAAGVPITAAGTDIETVFAGGRIGFKYVMPNLVDVRATWMNAGGTNLNNAAFGINVLAVPNLTAQFEGNITSLGNTAAGNIELFENVAYVMGPLTPALNLDEVLYNVSGLNAQIAINPSIDYAVMTGTNVGLSVTYTMNVAGASTSKLVADPYVKFVPTSNATVKIDAAYTINDLSATGTWSLPININFIYSF